MVGIKDTVTIKPTQIKKEIETEVLFLKTKENRTKEVWGFESRKFKMWDIERVAKKGSEMAKYMHETAEHMHDDYGTPLMEIEVKPKENTKWNTLLCKNYWCCETWSIFNVGITAFNLLKIEIPKALRIRNYKVDMIFMGLKTKMNERKIIHF